MAEIVPASLATWRPFTGKGTTLLRRDIICYHTMVGTLPGSWSWANGAGRAYWHFGTGGDGQCWQCHPLEYRSASNLYGNPYVIPIENADMGPGFGPWGGQCGQVPPLTDAQIDRLVPLTAWLCARYGIPPVFIPDTHAGRRGIAWHRQGIQGWPEYRGGLIWSTAPGKCCPDDDRIHQLKTIILPRVRVLLGVDQPPAPPGPVEVPDMYIAETDGHPDIVVGPYGGQEINDRQKRALRMLGVPVKTIDNDARVNLMALGQPGSTSKAVSNVLVLENAEAKGPLHDIVRRATSS